MPELFAEYSAVLAMVWLATLVFEAGANSGLTRYLAEAAKSGARGTFYRRMQRRRWLVALVCGAALVALGPWYARATHFTRLAAEPRIFIAVGLIVAVILTRLLAHYGLLALFETRKALVLQQAFLVGRSALLATIAVLGGTLWHLIAGLLAVSVAEAVLADWLLWRQIGAERGPISPAFLNAAQKFGLLTILDKACAALGSGAVLLLVLAPYHPAGQIAFLALAADLVGKLVSVTVMPMSNLVGPYLSHLGDDAEAQGRAAARVIKLSSLLYCASVGAGVLVLPAFIPLVYGQTYAGAVVCTLLLLVPTAYENWVRGACSPALLRNGCYRQLSSLNALQAVTTLGTLWLVHRESLPHVLIAVGTARAAVATLSFVPLRQFVPRGACGTPLRGLASTLLACGAAWLCARWLAMPPLAAIAVQAAIFGAAFYLGMRWLVFRDADTLALAHRLAGARFAGWLLPPLPAPNR